MVQLGSVCQLTKRYDLSVRVLWGHWRKECLSLASVCSSLQTPMAHMASQGLAIVTCSMSAASPGTPLGGFSTQLSVKNQPVDGFPQQLREQISSNFCWHSTPAFSLPSNAPQLSLSSEVWISPTWGDSSCGTSSAPRVWLLLLSALPIFLSVFFASY